MTEPTPRKRLSRYRPDPKAVPAFELNDRHRRILELVYQHRFLDTEILSHLLGVAEPSPEPKRAPGAVRPRKYGFGAQALYKTLQKLFNARYLNRHFLYDVPTGRGRGSPPTVYGLGPKSARVLSETVGCPPKDVQDIVEANTVKSPFLRHALEVARFRVVLELACAQSNGRVRLLFWEQGLHLRDYVTGRDAKGKERRFTVYPDAAFALHVADEDKGRAFYFLELDRGTMPVRAQGERSDIVGKLYGYRYYRERKLHSRRYAYRVLPDGTVGGMAVCDRTTARRQSATSGVIPVPGFNVLFVVPGGESDNARVSPRIRYILTAMQEMGSAFTSSTLFWFTTSKAYSLQSPVSILRSVWTTARNDLGPQSLLGRHESQSSGVPASHIPPPPLEDPAVL